jgi:RHS repeat-associated protein
MQRLAQASCQLIRDPIAISDSFYGWPNNRTKYGYDTANRLVSGLVGTGGTPQFQYGYDHASNLTSIAPNGPTQSYSYTSTNAITSGSYDSNGSPTSLGGKSYKWDGENRIVNFANSAANTSSTFTYDGFGRLVRIVDTHAGAITSDRSFTWCGSARCLAHDNTQANSPVSTQYFDQGVIVGGTAYYYVKDQLGSVTELVTTSGTVASQFTYDPYGNQTTISGTSVDIGYAGLFSHPVSGLDFAMFRAYDPVHSRWLNRDPIAERGGVNLYAYVQDDPISGIDPGGLLSYQISDSLIPVDVVPNRPTADGGTDWRFTITCKCTCGSSSRLMGCNVHVYLMVYILRDLSGSHLDFVKHGEGQHTADMAAASGSFKKAGESAELGQASQTFSSERKCEYESKDIVATAMTNALSLAYFDSARHWDKDYHHWYFYTPLIDTGGYD